jgi:excisionase family DNA binding protein
MQVQRICQYCEKQFEAQKLTTKFCSSTCSKRNYKRQERDKKAGKAAQEVKDFLEKPMAEIKEKDFLSVAETCKLLGVSRWTIYRAISEKRIKSTKIGSRTIISRAGLDALFVLGNDTLTPPETVVAPIDWSTTPIEACYTNADIQRIFNLKQGGVYNWAKQHNIPKIRVWRDVYYPKEAIKHLLPVNHQSNQL